MSKRKTTTHGDSVLTPEELKKAIEEYKARRAERLAANADSEDKPAEEAAAATEVATDNEEVAATAAEETAAEATATDEGEAETAAAEAKTTEEQVQLVKDRRDRRDAAGDPETLEEAEGVIAKQDEDMTILFDIIDTLLANADFAKADSEAEATAAEGEKTAEETTATDEGEEEEKTTVGAAVATDNAGKEAPAAEGKMNADSVDAIVRTRIQLGMVGRKINLDGLENMRIIDAKKAIVNAVRPGLRLDGKSVAYVNAAYDMAVAEVNSRSEKDTNYQKKQMFNRDGKPAAKVLSGADEARARMIERRNNK